ncbi:serine protease inhibitor swm-1-like isoform X1 [Phyllobates terribilis]|uniref:serine protease inhibitor swm-1-like isoform X1 n=1 Tax=Phyllobates terribilis TaxID=111132 RepID=UPI003CCB4735
MRRTSAVLLASLTLLLMVITAQSAAIKCKADEEYNECGSPCPPTCDSLNRVCPAVCKAGCFCKKGTVQNANGKCVPVKDCCSGNTVYNECGNDCPNTCKDVASSNPYPVLCTLNCYSGCFCKPGYVRLPNSKECVRPKHCPKNSKTY